MPTLAGCTFSSQQPVSFSNFLSARMDQLFGWFSCLFYLGVSCGCLYSLLKQALRNLDINIIHLVLCQWGSLWTRTTALRQNALPVIGRSKEKRIQFSIAGLKLRKQLKRTGNASARCFQLEQEMQRIDLFSPQTRIGEIPFYVTLVTVIPVGDLRPIL